MNSLEKIIFVLLWAIFTAILFSYTADDAYISFRYAQNLVHYGIWNWNADHDYVEAYTSASYTALAIIPQFLGIPTQLFFKMLGLALFLRLLWKIHALCPDRTIRLLFMGFILANPNIYVLFYSGLETPLFIVLSLELYSLFLSGKHVRWFYALLLLLPLTRPEGGIISAIMLSAFVYRNRKVPEPLTLLMVIIAGMAYFTWRCWYFGYLMPNTFYAKLLTENAGNIVVIRLLSLTPYLVLFGVLIAWIRNRNFTLIALAALAVYAIAYLNSNLWMNYADRFALQLFLPVIISSLYYAGNFPRKNLLGLPVLLAWLVVPAYNVSEMKEYFGAASGVYYTNTELGKNLAAYRDSNYTLAVIDAGVVPYYSQWKTYDLAGLADTTIAHSGKTISYMQQINPDLIIVPGDSKEAQSMRVKQFKLSIVDEYIRSSGQYDFIDGIQMGTSGYSLVFLKKNMKDYAIVGQIVRDIAVNSVRINERDILEKHWFRWEYFADL